MKVISSYGVELKKINKFLAQTAAIYRKSIDFLIGVFECEWDSLRLIKNPQQRALAAERLIHNTSKNIAKYEFDTEFPKFPSYLRRSAVKAALGILSSYHSNLENWEESGRKSDLSEFEPRLCRVCKGNVPTLPKTTRLLPVFYRENMYLEGEDPYTAYLKLYVRNDWVWVQVRLKKTDVDYLRKYWSHTKASAPILEKRYGKYFLRFSFEEDVTLNVTELENQIVCAVDLGVNTDAVCSILTSDGTVAIRKFINFPADKDRLYKVLDSIRELQSRRGPKCIKGLWAFANSAKPRFELLLCRICEAANPTLSEFEPQQS